jgi:hypothetical protein
MTGEGVKQLVRYRNNMIGVCVEDTACSSSWGEEGS